MIRALRFTFQLLVVGMLGVCSAYAAQDGDVSHLTAAEMLSTSGRGFSTPPYSLASEDVAGADSKWAPITLPYSEQPSVSSLVADDPEHPQTTVRWYRVHVPHELIALKPLYLYIPRWKSNGQIAVYGNGRQLYRSNANVLWNGSNQPLWIPLDGMQDLPEASQNIIVRIEYLSGTGSGLSSLWVGSEAAVGWRYRIRDLLQVQLPLMTSAAFLAVGLYSLFVWMRRRRDRIYLLFFFLSLLFYLRTMHYYVGRDRLPVSDEVFGWLTVNSLFWLIVVSHFFMVCLHGQKQVWLGRAVVGVSLAISILTLPVVATLWSNATLLAPLVYIFLLSTGWVVFGMDLRNSIRVRSVDGILLAGWGLFSMVVGVYDWMLQNNFVSVEGSFMGAYASIGIFLIFMIIMFRRYVHAIEDVQRLNASLEERLHAREIELMESHERLREIEQRQTLSQERQRLVQDMHDGLGSSLVSALRVVESGQLQEAQVAEILKSCIDDLRLAIDSMEPIEADLLLLLATLRFRMGSRLTSTGINLHWDITEVPSLEWLDPRNALHILRILQETFTNILKHAQATEIRVRTGAGDGWVMVIITDNGRGFALDYALKSGGKGLANQMRRAQAIGAEILLESSVNGTCMTLRLPELRA